MFLTGIILLAFVGSILTLPSSSCPDLFRYNSENKNQWIGTLTLISDNDLHGVWVRLIFDETYEDISVSDGFETKPSDNLKEVLIKKPDFLLKPFTPKELKITVKYGSKVPKLIVYRLNARIICSEEDKSSYFFGDLTSTNFLSNIISQKSPVKGSEFAGCGTTPLSQNTDFLKSLDQRAKPGQWPWHASIYIRRQNKDNYICSGTLISPRHILTAAHCVHYNTLKFGLAPKHLGVKLGIVNPNYDNHNSVEVEKVVLYPGYTSENLINDLAVISLQKAVNVDDHIRPICLGHGNVQGEGYLVGSGIEGKAAPVLSQAKVNIVNREKCDEQIGSVVSDNDLCGAYVSDNSVCVGDSGSGLVSLRQGSKPVWQLNGILSVGPFLQQPHRCGKDGLVVLTDISRYSRWIHNVIA